MKLNTCSYWEVTSIEVEHSLTHHLVMPLLLSSRALIISPPDFKEDMECLSALCMEVRELAGAGRRTCLRVWGADHQLVWFESLPKWF